MPKKKTKKVKKIKKETKVKIVEVRVQKPRMLWKRAGLTGAIIMEILLFLFSYMFNRNIESGALALLSFPPTWTSVLIVLVIGFGIGAVVGLIMQE